MARKDLESMKSITETFHVSLSREKAFQKFVKELNAWWPKEYTWSQDKLEYIGIDARKDGLCTEIGPHGFRCDWGRVTELRENDLIAFKWQISAKREPIPDPDKASDIRIRFKDDSASKTILEFEHYNFQNHGEGADDYRKMMDGEMGWEYILDRFRKYCGG